MYTARLFFPEFPMATNRKEMSNTEARKQIEKDVEAFLKAGKKIQQIPTGTSGQDAMASRKHLVLGQGKKKAQE